MKFHCPKCHHTIPAAKMNVETDVAVCPRCDEAFTLSDLVEEADESPVVPDEPPPGAWFRADIDGWQVGATTRSSARVSGALHGGLGRRSMAGIYGSQLVKGEFNLVISLFGIPFLPGSIVLVTMSLMTLVGDLGDPDRQRRGDLYRNRLAGLAATVPLGRDRQVEETASTAPEQQFTRHGLALVGKTRLKFGSL